MIVLRKLALSDKSHFVGFFKFDLVVFQGYKGMLSTFFVEKEIECICFNARNFSKNQAFEKLALHCKQCFKNVDFHRSEFGIKFFRICSFSFKLGKSRNLEKRVFRTLIEFPGEFLLGVRFLFSLK